MHALSWHQRTDTYVQADGRNRQLRVRRREGRENKCKMVPSSSSWMDCSVICLVALLAALLAAYVYAWSGGASWINASPPSRVAC